MMLHNAKTADDPGQASAPLSQAGFFERMLFGHRKLILGFFALATVVLGWEASHLKMEASFEKMIPTYHPYIANYLRHKQDLTGLGNVLWIAVENKQGDIFDKEYIDTLRRITDEVFHVKGVDRGAVKSLWMPAVRWKEINEKGFSGGPVISETYDGSPRSLAELRTNVFKSGEIGKLVANNLRSSLIVVPLLERDPETGSPIDYQKISSSLETLIRDKFQQSSSPSSAQAGADKPPSAKIGIHIVGFAKLVGDLIDGANQVALFFAATVLISMALLYLYTRSLRATLIPLFCALVAVVWQAGLLYWLGYGLDPYSMLVPFLVFAIGVSHGVQMINGVYHQTMLGRNKFDAARFAFRLLWIQALCALVSDGAGFATLYLIRIGVLQDMAVGAAIRFPVLIFAMLGVLPLLLSYSGVSQRAVQHEQRVEDKGRHPLWQFLSRFATRRGSIAVLLIVALSTVWGLDYRKNLQVGDLDRGAPELRPESRYNRDNQFVVDNYDATSDLFVVMLETPKEGNSDYGVLAAAERLQWQLENLPGVQSTESIVDRVKFLNAAYNEGNFKWYGLPRDKTALDTMVFATAGQGLANEGGSLSLMYVYLNDHKAATLDRVVKAVEAFATDNDSVKVSFKMAAGPAGIEAATNIEIDKAQYRMLLLVYVVVTVLVLLTFRSVRATICVMVPLALTSLLCEVLMPMLGIGVKVATLPVISVGVGIGVDYGVYIYSRLLTFLDEGLSLQEAYYQTLRTTGTAVAFTGITLAAGVFTWYFSAIKFQADMGILLTFMFLWNMVGALVVLPALAYWLAPAGKSGHTSGATALGMASS